MFLFTVHFVGDPQKKISVLHTYSCHTEKNPEYCSENRAASGFWAKIIHIPARIYSFAKTN